MGAHGLRGAEIFAILNIQLSLPKRFLSAAISVAQDLHGLPNALGAIGPALMAAGR